MELKKLFQMYRGRGFGFSLRDISKDTINLYFEKFV